MTDVYIYVEYKHLCSVLKHIYLKHVIEELMQKLLYMFTFLLTYYLFAIKMDKLQKINDYWNYINIIFTKIEVVFIK